MINDLSRNGVYRQISDENGRELPAKLNYGRSILIASTTIQIAQDSEKITANTKAQTVNLRVKKILKNVVPNLSGSVQTSYKSQVTQATEKDKTGKNTEPKPQSPLAKVTVKASKDTTSSVSTSNQKVN